MLSVTKYNKIPGFPQYIHTIITLYSQAIIVFHIIFFPRLLLLTVMELHFDYWVMAQETDVLRWPSFYLP